MFQRAIILNMLAMLSMTSAQEAGSGGVVIASPPPPPANEGWQTWEIALAAGSGGVALLLLLYACLMRPRKKETKPVDIETGTKKESAGTKKPGTKKPDTKPDTSKKSGASASQVKVAVPKASKETKAGNLASKLTASVKSVVGTKEPPPAPVPKLPERKVRSLPPARKGSM
jgi:hypothetical protein